MKKIFNSRFFTIVVLLLAITTLFSACMGSSQPQEIKLEIKNYDGSKNLFQEETLEAIATKIYNNQEARDAFLAAYRGYDVIDGQYEGYSENLGVNYDYVKKVIEKYTDFKITFNDPVENNPEQGAPEEGAPEQGAPEQGTPEQGAPEQGAPAQSVSATVLTDEEKFHNDADLILKAMQTNIELEANRDLLGNIRYWIGSFLGLITNTIGFGQYLIGICIFAIVVEILMIPFAIKQQKNSIKQAKLRPKEIAIRNRYKGRNDQATQQKVTQEIQELYQRENFNPMSGCLPMLIQLPIIMLLYNIVVDPIQNVLGGSASLSSALTMYATSSEAAGGLGLSLKASNGTIELLSKLQGVDLSSIENFGLFSNGPEVFEAISGMQAKFPSFNIGNVNFGLAPGFNNPEQLWLLIVPVLTFVVYFGSMKISKKFTYQPTQNENAPGAGCSTKVMEYYMPLMSTVFCFMVPGAIGIYWVFRSILSTLKQFIMSKVMPLPKFTEEDIKEAERELNSKRPQRKRKNENDLDPNRERPRSLHHIDDDDEDYPTFVQ